jgi:hypothetical protein
MVCPNCYNSDFRISRLRTHDLPRLLFMQYPVRCRTCKERLYRNLLMTLNLRHARRQERGQQDFTGTDK